jgi:hypothetical protein
LFICLNFGLNDIYKKSVTLVNLVCYYLQIGNLGINEATEENNGSPSSHCEHNIIYDEEIGDYCKSCGTVITESKYKTQLVVSKVSC